MEQSQVQGLLSLRKKFPKHAGHRNKGVKIAPPGTEVLVEGTSLLKHRDKAIGIGIDSTNIPLAYVPVKARIRKHRTKVCNFGNIPSKTE